eukprot:g891.t1
MARRPQVGLKESKAKDLKNAAKKKAKIQPLSIDTSTKKKKSRKREKKKDGIIKKILKKLFPKAMEDIEVSGTAEQAVELLGLTQRDLKRLKAKFLAVDLDGSGEIDYDEFFEFIDDVRSPYSDALFKLIDLDGSGTIDFNEFVQVLATYCMYGRDEILKFCFETFDKDGSGTIDEEEFIELMKTINNMNPSFPGNFRRALEEFDRNDDGLIDFDEFREINRRYPLVLFPAFRLQDRMQKSTLGEWAWNRIQKNMQRDKEIEEYKAKHDGELPPDKFSVRMVKRFCPCCHKKSKYELEYEEELAEQAENAKKGKGRRKKKKKKKKKKQIEAIPGEPMTPTTPTTPTTPASPFTPDSA